jgi:hypothetical protein
VADATTVALVSVVVTGTTAIAVPVVNGVVESRREQRRFEHERITKDFDDLRDLLDEMTAKVYAHLRELSFYVDPSRKDEAALAAEDRLKELHQLVSRLQIRLGRAHPVTEAFAACLFVTPDPGWDSLMAPFRRYTDAVQQLIGARLDSEASKR